MKHLFDRLCFVGWHKWKMSWLKNEHRYFRVRDCRRCSKREIEHNGPIGDGKWHDVDDDKTWSGPVGEYERKNYLGAKPES